MGGRRNRASQTAMRPVQCRTTSQNSLDNCRANGCLNIDGHVLRRREYTAHHSGLRISLFPFQLAVHHDAYEWQLAARSAGSPSCTLPALHITFAYIPQISIISFSETWPKSFSAEWGFDLICLFDINATSDWAPLFLFTKHFSGAGTAGRIRQAAAAVSSRAGSPCGVALICR